MLDTRGFSRHQAHMAGWLGRDHEGDLARVLIYKTFLKLYLWDKSFWGQGA